MKKISIVLIEDEPVVQRNLSAYLNAHPDVEVIGIFGRVEDWRDAHEHDPSLRPGILLLDINLPGMSGLEGIGLIRRQLPDCDIIMLTTFEDNDKIFKALCSGACSYLSKQTPLQKILEAVLVVSQGGSYMSPAIARKVVLHFAPKPKAKKARLSPRQMQIVEGLTEGLSYKQTADLLVITLETVRTHIKHIYRELQVNSKAELIRKSFEGEI